MSAKKCACTFYFYPRSPCGERQDPISGTSDIYKISIHALLAESDLFDEIQASNIVIISIHALLAESDPKRFRDALKHLHFYPRSPCGERQKGPAKTAKADRISIHALLAESDRPQPPKARVL